MKPLCKVVHITVKHLNSINFIINIIAGLSRWSYCVCVCVSVYVCPHTRYLAHANAKPPASTEIIAGWRSSGQTATILW